VNEPTIRILGPLAVWRDGRAVDLGQRRQRLMLGILALSAGQPVKVSRLTEIAWFGAAPPPSARNGIQVGMSRLRTALGDTASISTVGNAYRLDIDHDRVDVFRFRALVAAARERRDGARVTALRDAERLWRGPVLAAELPPGVRQWLCAGLNEERVAAIEERVAAELDLGRHRELIGDLTDLVRAMPTRERLVAQLMLALYRDGQTARALEVAANAKRILADDLGIDASREIRELEVAILRQAPDLDIEASSVAVAGTAGHAHTPAQLPLDSAGFIGRRAQLDALDAIFCQVSTGITTRTGNGGPTDDVSGTRVAVVTGTAGVGKTTLAVRWAHGVRARFPDGQLFADMRGYAATPAARPDETLARFLHALGVPADRVPADVDDAAGMYRSILADKRVLVVLDNVADADQVRPLLPGGPGCGVMITSRHRLDGLVARDGARHLGLAVLTDEDAYALLGRALGDERVAGEPGAAHELARLCAYLPLALRVAAATLASAPRRPIADYVATLRNGNRLAALAIDGDPHSAVRSAFDLSYIELDEPTRRVFRLLGTAPGRDITALGVAALAGCDAEAAHQALHRLIAGHLVDELTPGRYTMHDLLRIYAAEHANREDDQVACVDRLLAWYVFAARRATSVVYPHIVQLDMPEQPGDCPTTPVGFGTDGEAAAWLEAECSNLLAVAESAARTGRERMSWLLTDALRGYLWHTRQATEWLPVVHTGLDAALRMGDARAESAMRLGLACVNHCLARRETAIEQYVAARDLACRTGWTEVEDAILANLGVAYAEGGDCDAAVESFRLALSLANSPARTAMTLLNLGSVLHQMGHLRDAARQHEAALDLARRTDFASGEATALQFLGYTEHSLGRLQRAQDHLTMALWVHRRIGNRHREAQTLMDLAGVHLDAGRYADAITSIESAYALVHERSDLLTESLVLTMRGRVRVATERIDEALADITAALDLAAQARALYIQTEATIGLADAYRAAGRFDDALHHASAALAIAERTGYRAVAGDALTVLAATRAHLGDTDTAISDAERALVLHRRSGHRVAEARALYVLASVVRARQPAEAERHERAARKIVDWMPAWRGPDPAGRLVRQTVGEARIA
jgi:DNA-binding SARP family transcriptional activator